MILVAIKNLLANDVNYTSVVGNDKNGTSKKIYATRVPQDETGTISLLNVITAPPVDKCKGSKASLYSYTVQLDHFGEDYGTVTLAANYAVDVLENYQGIVLGQDIQDIKIDDVARDLHEDDAREFHKSQDFIVYVKR